MIFQFPNEGHWNPSSGAKGGPIRKFKDVAGVYVWTHLATGRQCIGSSKNQFGRLKVYFQPSGLKSMANNSNMLIAKLLLKYGWDAFSLTIIYAGGTGAEAVALEQLYLDYFTCSLNINRNASGKQYKSTGYSPVGAGNPMHGRKGELSPVWGRSHEQSQLDSWKQARTKGPYYLYNIVTKEFIGVFTNLFLIAKLINITYRLFAAYVDTGTIINGTWIISTTPIKDIGGFEPSGTVVIPPVDPRRQHNNPRRRPVYVYDLSKSKLIASYDSIGDCAAAYTCGHKKVSRHIESKSGKPFLGLYFIFDHLL